MNHTAINQESITTSKGPESIINRYPRPPIFLIRLDQLGLSHSSR